MSGNQLNKIADLQFLIVDDQPFIRGIVQGMLRSLGARHIRAVTNGEEALGVLRESSVDFVISDWNMGPVNGLKLLRNIRARLIPEVSATLPFILLSGYGASLVVTTALNLDVSAYLVKPVSAAKLGGSINDALRKQWTLKPNVFYERIEVGEAPNEVRKIGPTAAQWAEWVKQGKQEYSDSQASHLTRRALDVTEITGPSEPEVRHIRHKYLDAVKPGSVLIEEVCDAEGVALLVPGTVISEKMLRRLKAHESSGGEKMRLWVGRLVTKPSSQSSEGGKK